MSASVVSQSVVVQHAQGVHARPAELLARTAIKFECDITFVLDDHQIDAKSILNILTLGAGQGAEIRVEATGSDAQQAVDALTQLIQSDFDPEQNNPKTHDRAG